MTALLALLPILVLLLLMLGAGWSAARAGVAGVVVTLGLAVLAFDFPRAAAPALGLAGGLAGVTAEAAFTALTVLWIIGPALGIHEL
jgi:lactate permease